MSRYIDISNTWANDRIEAIKKSYNDKGLKASGNFERSLSQKVSSTATSLSIIFEGADYSQFMQFGRASNKNQSPDKIKAWVGWAGSTILREWVKQKRLSISPYAVAWKIAREGIKVPNKHNKGGVISDAFPKDSFDALFAELGDVITSEIQSKYIEKWQ